MFFHLFDMVYIISQPGSVERIQ